MVLGCQIAERNFCKHPSIISRTTVPTSPLVAFSVWAARRDRLGIDLCVNNLYIQPFLGKKAGFER
jgi:hypothetical protein